jgi:hypothetical protein
MRMLAVLAWHRRVMGRIQQMLAALTRPEDRVLWAIVALVVGYLVLGALVRSKPAGPAP